MRMQHHPHFMLWTEVCNSLSNIFSTEVVFYIDTTSETVHIKVDEISFSSMESTSLYKYVDERFDEMVAGIVGRYGQILVKKLHKRYFMKDKI